MSMKKPNTIPRPIPIATAIHKPRRRHSAFIAKPINQFDAEIKGQPMAILSTCQRSTDEQNVTTSTLYTAVALA